MPYENTCTYAVCIAGSILISENVTIQGEILNKFYCQPWDPDIDNRQESRLTPLFVALADPVGTRSTDRP